MTRPQKWKNLAIGLVITYFFISGNRGLWNLYRLQHEKQNISEQISQLESEINHYQSEYQTFGKNSCILEKQAREELNLVRPGEVVYIFARTENR
jgi:cell division protein FtsB